MNPPSLHQEFVKTVAAIPAVDGDTTPDQSRRHYLAGIGTLANRLRDQLKAADMSELNFAKSFLTALDTKTTKYPSDHVFDPKTFPPRIPFTLPKLAHPPHPPPPKTSSTPAAPGSTSATPTATILLKSTRNPALSLFLSDIAPNTTTIASLKESVQVALGGASVVSLEKIKILHNKKPIPASKKTIADAVDGKAGKEIEFGVMVMGGAPDQIKSPAEAIPTTDTFSAIQEPEPADVTTTPMEGVEKITGPPVSMAAEGSGPSGVEVLNQAEFWDDLQGFLEQRLRDQGEAGRLRKVFEEAWRASG